MALVVKAMSAAIVWPALFGPGSPQWDNQKLDCLFLEFDMKHLTYIDNLTLGGYLESYS